MILGGNVAADTRTPAKLTRPEPPPTCARARLLTRLDESLSHAATWVTGPPGAGKTTLVASFLDTSNIDYLWYQIDPGDNDVATFFGYLTQAFSSHRGRPRKTLPTFSPAYARDLEGFSRRFFRSLFAELPEPFVLVLDDYQNAGNASPVHVVLGVAIEQAPRGMSIVVTSRFEPPGRLARLRVNQSVTCIRSEELALKKSEIREMALARGTPIGGAALDALFDKTRGWMAGVLLLLDHQSSATRFDDLPASATPDVVVDYLAEELIDGLSAQTRSLLFSVVFVPRLTTEMAQRLCPGPDTAASLEELTRNHYFVSKVHTDSGAVFQLHPLLREMLSVRAVEFFSSERLEALLAESSDSLWDAGYVDDAVELWIEQQNWPRLERRVADYASVLLAHGRGETLTRWLESVPERFMNAHPWLLYWWACAQFHIAARTSRRLFERAVKSFEGDADDEVGLILSCCGVIDSIFYDLDDLSLVDPWIEKLDTLAHAGGEPLSAHVEARVTCSMFMSLVLRRPDHPALRSWLRRAEAVAASSVDDTVKMTIHPLLALSAMWGGHFNRALGLMQSMHAFTADRDVSPIAESTLYVVKAMHAMLVGDGELCVSAVATAESFNREHGIALWGEQLSVIRVGGLLGAGDVDAAGRTLGDLADVIDSAGRLDRCLYHYFSAWRDTLQDDVLGAYQQQKKALYLALELGIPFFEILCRLAQAQILYACGDHRNAQTQLHKVHQLARDIDNPLLEYMTLLVYAHIVITHGKQRSGLKALRYALALGREHDYTHFLGWQPRLMAELCTVALREGVEQVYVRKLIRARALEPDSATTPPSSWPWRIQVFSLGAFKLVIDDEERSFSGKAPSRPLELLKVLIALGGRDVKATRLGEVLWPHVDGDYAHRSFTTTLHRLRKLLGADTSVLLQDGRVSLNGKLVCTDTWMLEAQFDSVEHMFRQATPSDVKVHDYAQRMLGAYRGVFLDNEDEHGVYHAYREHLRRKFVRLISKLVAYWREAGQCDVALTHLEWALELDSLAEDLYRQLMLSYNELGRTSDAFATYRRCQEIWSASLELAPSAETTRVFEAIRAKA